MSSTRVHLLLQLRVDPDSISGPETRSRPPRIVTRMMTLPRFSAAQVWRAVPRLVLNLLVPFVVYQVSRSYVDSDAIALAISAVVPTLWTVGRFAVRRRLDPFGVISVVVCLLTILVTVLTGGSALGTELLSPVLFGLVGLVVFGAALVGRPLDVLFLRLVNRDRPVEPARQHATTVIIAAVGGLFAVRGVVLTLLALALPVSGYVAVSGIVGWGTLILGGIPIFWYRQRRHARNTAAAGVIGQIWAAGSVRNTSD